MNKAHVISCRKRMLAVHPRKMYFDLAAVCVIVGEIEAARQKLEELKLKFAEEKEYEDCNWYINTVELFIYQDSEIFLKHFKATENLF